MHGLHPHFLTSKFLICWSLIKKSLGQKLKKQELPHVKTFNIFHDKSVPPSSVHASSIALVLKIPSALKTQEFRPISLIHGVYKIVANVLASRL